MATNRTILGVLPALSGTSGTEYISPTSRNQFTTTQAHATHRWLQDCTFYNLRINTAIAPALGVSHTFTLQVNGLDTSLVAVLAAGSTEAISTGSATVMKNDTITLKRTRAGGVTSSLTGLNTMSLEVVGTETGVSCYGGIQGAAGAVGGGSPAAIAIFSTLAWIGAGFVNVYDLMAVAGTLTEMRIDLQTAPGLGNAFTFKVYKNGSAQPLTAVVISGVATTGTGTFSLALAVGDYVYLRVDETSGTPAQVAAGVAFRFVSTLDGYSQMGTSSSANLASSTTQYHTPTQAGVYGTYNNKRLRGGISPITITRIAVMRTNWFDSRTVQYFFTKNDVPATDLAVSVGVINIDPAPSSVQTATGQSTITSLDTFAIGYTTPSTMNGSNTDVWGFAQYAPSLPLGTIGPLAWLHWPRRVRV